MLKCFFSLSTLLSRNKLGRVRNSVARSRMHCWRGNATMYVLCTVELHVTSNNIKIFIDNTAVLLRWICVASYSNTYCGLPVKCSIFLVQFEPDLMEFIGRFFSPVSKFTKIRPVGAALILADRRTDRHDDARSRFPRLCESTRKLFFRQERVPHREHTAR